MNPGRGWIHDLEELYLPKYSEYEAEMFTQCSAQNFIWPVKSLDFEISPISRYSQCTKTTSFSMLGFFRHGVKLGFDFPRVLPNQKI